MRGLLDATKSQTLIRLDTCLNTKPRTNLRHVVLLLLYQKTISIEPMRADSPSRSTSKALDGIIDEWCARSPPPICRKTREQRRWGEGSSGVGVYKTVSRLPFLSLYPTHLVVLLPKYPWSAFMECVSGLSSKNLQAPNHEGGGFSVRILHQN